MERGFLSSLPQGVDRELIARVLDCCDIASQQQRVKYTDFLDPFHREFVRPIIANFFGIRFLEEGGYPPAEQKRIIIYPDYYKPGDLEPGVALMEITLSDPAKPLSHRDYLGSLMNMGLRRGVMGDILPYEGGAQVFVAAEVAESLLGLEAVSRFKAEARIIPPYQVRFQEQPQRTITATVASLRLDAVLSAGLGLGRSKVSELVKGDKVRVNWREISQPSFTLQQGDVVSVRGRGRIELSETLGETKKGRIRITVKKFV
jgi:RNA-binding protein YlmH